MHQIKQAVERSNEGAQAGWYAISACTREFMNSPGEPPPVGGTWGSGPEAGAMVERSVWQLSDILTATGGELLRPEGPRQCAGVSTDTRRLRPQEIFVALRGQNHDGHAFVEEAVTRGAAVVAGASS